MDTRTDTPWNWNRFIRAFSVTAIAGAAILLLTGVYVPENAVDSTTTREAVTPVLDKEMRVDSPQETDDNATRPSPPETNLQRLKRLYPAAAEVLVQLRYAESSNGQRMLGDGGLARGWLQQHAPFWREGCARLGLDYAYPRDSYDLAKAEEVTFGYWLRHCPGDLADGNREMLIRRFRLPYAPFREDNTRYYEKVSRFPRAEPQSAR